MMNTEAPPSQGLVGGKYQLIRMIGRGGMGSVWEARHASLGTPSAIKFIEAEYADSQEARSRFDREAKAAATIQSKHAIQIYDHGVTDDGKPYIVMELLQGEPLDKRIDRLCRMSLQDTARIIQQVSRGLARAHERGIIHRDLKPENIFIVRNQDDDEEVAKVLDFGIAKMSNGPGNPGMTSSTKTGAVLGTPFYMSPEQARGLRNVDHRTDVWSLGVIAFKCITGKLPFDGESVGDLLVKICTSPVPVPSQVVPGIPPNFDAWFMRALEREPERRFPNVTELSDALAFAAGIATRSQQGAPLAQVATIGAGPGMITPHGLSTPPPQHGTGSQGYASHTPSGYGAQSAHAPTMQTPAPGAMTNAPFTSEPNAGTASGKGKLVVGGILAGILAIAATVGVVLVLRKPPALPDTARSADPPPASVAAKDDKPVVDDKPDDKSKDSVAAKDDDKPATDDPTPGPDATAARAAAGAATTTTKATAKPPATAKTGGKTAAPPLPPATAPTAPATTTAKKPPRDRTDPGY
ncbi:MAG: serine/threonine protein kinase [Labilithrix sp.]|nr:serine/threonine protein kinase [Labilithrix sp.]